MGRYSVGIVLASLIWVAALALNLVPQLRGGYGWVWSYQGPSNPARIVPLVLACSLYIGVAWWLMQHQRITGKLVWAIVSSIALTMASLYVFASPLFKLNAATLSGGASGWHYAAARITDLGATLRDWPRFMQESTRFSSHMGIAPPGLVVFYYAIQQTLAHLTALADGLGRPLRALQCHRLGLMTYSNAQLASAWAGILMPLWGSLVVLPLYQLGRRLLDQTTLQWSILWWPLVPSFLMFAPLPNIAYPLLATLVMLLLMEGLCRNQARWIVAAGALMSVLTFVSFAFLPLIVLAGLFVLGTWLAKTDLFTSSRAAHLKWRWPLLVGFGFGLGLPVAWLIFYAVSGVPVWDILQIAAPAHVAMNRPYWPWLFLHTYDYLMFTGWPLVGLVLLGVWRAIGKLRTSQRLSDMDILALAASVTFVALIVSGTLRGESGRILQFITPLFLLVAAGALSGYPSKDAHRSAWILTVGQVVTVIVMVGFLRVITTEFDQEPPSAPPTVAQTWPASSTPSSAIFGNALRLLSFSGKIERQADGMGDTQPTLVLWLEWEPQRQVDQPYWLSFIPVAPNGEAAAEASLRQPFDGRYLMTCWLPRNGHVRHTEQIPLSEDIQGDWWVSLSLIDAETGDKVNVVLPDGSSDDQVGLGPFHFSEGQRAGG